MSYRYKVQPAIKEYLKKTYTVDQCKELKKACADHFFAHTCQERPAHDDCVTINRLYAKSMVSGKPCGHFFLSDMGEYIPEVLA